MDPVICCLLGICCPPFSAEQREIFEEQLALHFDGDKAKAQAVCDEAYEHFAKATQKIAECIEKHDKKA